MTTWITGIYIEIFSSLILFARELLMSTKLEVLLSKIKGLESELVDELQKQQEEFSYEITKRRVYFEKTLLSDIKNMPNNYSAI